MHPFDLDFFCRLNFQHSCLVFFTLQCVRLFAMSLSYNIIQTGESTKKLGSPLKWRFVFWQKRFAVVAGPSIEQLDITIAIHFFPSPLSPIMISPPRLFNEFGVKSLFLPHLSRLAFLVLIPCPLHCICWPSMSARRTVISIGKANSKRFVFVNWMLCNSSLFWVSKLIQFLLYSIRMVNMNDNEEHEW